MYAYGEKILKDPKPEYFEGFFNTYQGTSTPVAVIRDFNRIGIRECTNWLSKKIKDKEERNNAFSILVGTHKKSFAQKEQEEFKKLLKYAIEKERELFSRKDPEDILHQMDGKLKSKIGSYLEKYQWFPCGYENEDAWNELYVIKQLKEAMLQPEKTFKKIKRSENYQKNIKKKREELLSKLNPPKDMKKIFDVLSAFTYYKDHIRENLNRYHFMTRPYLEKVSKSIGLKGLECTELLPWDVTKLIKEKKKFKGKLLGESNYALLSIRDKVIVKKGKEAVNLHEYAISCERKKEDKVEGIGTSPGKVRGRVKLIFRPRHYYGEKDVVLIAPMTNPDLIPAMRNAVAIVTNEGGVTCHAAIVSRELGIPCIVGTKYATKVFKNDELVEVDANKGFIRKIK
ncbi:MAG: hypothetical protein ISS25_02570 [Nanoarchaeota archaeon]|nr:hypothetical protein [DPANN group archaeon]MBL7116689.1 hypothetical protein [Nanoarchaeota archaeon]